MDRVGLSEETGSRSDGTPCTPRSREKSLERGGVGPPSLLWDSLRSSQQLSEIADGLRGENNNLLLKGLNEERSLLWFWENSPPQLFVHGSNVNNKDIANSFVNENPLLNTSESSLVSPDKEMPTGDREPTHRWQLILYLIC